MPVLSYTSQFALTRIHIGTRSHTNKFLVSLWTIFEIWHNEQNFFTLMLVGMAFECEIQPMLEILSQSFHGWKVFDWDSVFVKRYCFHRCWNCWWMNIPYVSVSYFILHVFLVFFNSSFCEVQKKKKYIFESLVVPNPNEAQSELITMLQNVVENIWIIYFALFSIYRLVGPYCMQCYFETPRSRQNIFDIV